MQVLKSRLKEMEELTWMITPLKLQDTLKGSNSQPATPSSSC